MVTGHMSPSGSNMADDHFKISRFVVTDGVAVSPLGERYMVSFRVFQYHPSTLTVSLGSATLCCDASS